jgi:hypothetical protein
MDLAVRQHQVAGTTHHARSHHNMLPPPSAADHGAALHAGASNHHDW